MRFSKSSGMISVSDMRQVVTGFRNRARGGGPWEEENLGEQKRTRRAYRVPKTRLSPLHPPHPRTFGPAASPENHGRWRRGWPGPGPTRVAPPAGFKSAALAKIAGHRPAHPSRIPRCRCWLPSARRARRIYRWFDRHGDKPVGLLGLRSPRSRAKWKFGSTRIRTRGCRTFTGTACPKRKCDRSCARGEKTFPGRDSRIKLGQTAAGRYLQVIYVPDEDPESVFVITAYELQGKARTAYRRRQRRKPR